MGSIVGGYGVDALRYQICATAKVIGPLDRKDATDAALLAHRECSIADTAQYERQRPELTLLYQVVEHHYRVLIEKLEAQGHALPKFVQREFEA